MPKAYDKETRIMTLEDGALFVHLTMEQVNLMKKLKPALKVWVTDRSFIENVSSDIYGGKSVWAHQHKTLYSINSIDLVELRQAACIPLEEFNDPEWGDLAP